MGFNSGFKGLTFNKISRILGTLQWNSKSSKKGKVHLCTGTEALYRPYGP